MSIKNNETDSFNNAVVKEKWQEYLLITSGDSKGTAGGLIEDSIGKDSIGKDSIGKDKTNATKVACVSDFDLSMFSEEEIEAINTWIEFRSKTYNLKKTNQAIKVIINNLVTAKENGRNIPVMVDYFINNTTMQNINATNIEVAIKQIKASNKND